MISLKYNGRLSLLFLISTHILRVLVRVRLVSYLKYVLVASTLQHEEKMNKKDHPLVGQPVQRCLNYHSLKGWIDHIDLTLPT